MILTTALKFTIVILCMKLVFILVLLFPFSKTCKVVTRYSRDRRFIQEQSDKFVYASESATIGHWDSDDPLKIILSCLGAATVMVLVRRRETRPQAELGKRLHACRGDHLVNFKL